MGPSLECPSARPLPKGAPDPGPGGSLLTIGAPVQAVDPKSGVHLLHLSGSHLGHGLDGVHAAVLGKRHGDDLQGVGEGPHGILLQGRTLQGHMVIRHTWQTEQAGSGLPPGHTL